jgi:hypothetical protein
MQKSYSDSQCLQYAVWTELGLAFRVSHTTGSDKQLELYKIMLIYKPVQAVPSRTVRSKLLQHTFIVLHVLVLLLFSYSCK